jgi:bifunctional ADP-heptose synthase (sugar kinase/adenylyltransferase)
MPMNGAQLATEMKPEIEAKIKEFFEIISGAGDTVIADFAQALAEALGPKIVTHIQNNAVVTSTVVVTSVTGVVSGPATSGPGVGTATGTVA